MTGTTEAGRPNESCDRFPERERSARRLVGRMNYRYRICRAGDAPHTPLIEHVIEDRGQSEQTVRQEAIARAVEYEHTHGSVTVVLRGEDSSARAGVWHEVYTTRTLDPAPPTRDSRVVGGMAEWEVLLDGAHHKCPLPNDEPPRPGQVRMLGDVLARVDYIATTEEGNPVISATRAERA